MQVLWYAITTLHLFLCLLLIVVILLQQGKGADMGATFGGGSTQTVFGSRGPANFFHYMTSTAAALFMATSLYLAMFPAAPGAVSKFGGGSETPSPSPTAEATPEPGGMAPEMTPAEDGSDTDADSEPLEGDVP